MCRRRSEYMNRWNGMSLRVCNPPLLAWGLCMFFECSAVNVCAATTSKQRLCSKALVIVHSVLHLKHQDPRGLGVIYAALPCEHPHCLLS